MVVWWWKFNVCCLSLSLNKTLFLKYIGYKRQKQLNFIRMSVLKIWLSISAAMNYWSQQIYGSDLILRSHYHQIYMLLWQITLTALCQLGFKVKGLTHLKCYGGQWNGTLPLCVPDVQCPVLTPPFPGTLSSNLTEYGTEVIGFLVFISIIW